MTRIRMSKSRRVAVETSVVRSRSSELSGLEMPCFKDGRHSANKTPSVQSALLPVHSIVKISMPVVTY